ncbi:MAG: hypothetical protein K1W28_18595 [Lachnospiraceae bacterium]
MKKALKTLTALGTAALAVIGGLFLYRKFFLAEDDLDEDFDEDEELFEDEDDLTAFDSEEEIFEEEDEQPPVGEEKAAEADTSGKEETADEKEDEKTIEKEV